jgi:hypothetical protein
MMNKIAILVMIVQGSVALFLGLALFELWKSSSFVKGDPPGVNGIFSESGI